MSSFYTTISWVTVLLFIKINSTENKKEIKKNPEEMFKGHQKIKKIIDNFKLK